MKKNILITGSTDGIGLATAKMLVEDNHNILIHGRNNDKLSAVKNQLLELNPNASIDTFTADLSDMDQVRSMADSIKDKYKSLDILINNAGVFVLRNGMSKEGYDLRFMVNTIAPYLLTKLLLPIMNTDGRIVNLSSAAQGRVNLELLENGGHLSDGDAYSQSKLALTMWSMQLGKELTNGPSVIAVNPKSFLGSKMVKTAYGREGHDLRIGADILVRASLSDEFANASGKYFDNDYGRFSDPHPDALNENARNRVMNAMDNALEKL